MSFLTPLFLLGALAIAAPILYHLIRRTTRERKIFSSLMFLLPSPPRISRRHRLENIPLLLLRCAALALLAFGFARPFLKESPVVDPTGAEPRRTAILLDVSASMRRGGVWEAARARAEAVLDRASPSDHVALFTYDRQTTPLLTFEEWNRAAPGDRMALGRSRLAAVSPGWGGTHLGNALITAAESLSENEANRASGQGHFADGPREIVVVSDLQAGSRVDTLQAYEWPTGVAIRLEAVASRHPTNAGLQLIADPLDSTRALDAAVRVRVTNTADSTREHFKVGWSKAAGAADWIGTPLEAYVPPGQSRVFAVPVPKDAPESRHIALEGDDELFDNVVHVIPAAPQQASVLWLGADAADDPTQPLFFLRRAFTSTPRTAVQVAARAADAPLSASDLNAADLIFVVDPLTPGAAQALRAQAEAGKLVVAVPRNAAAAATLGRLLGREDLRLQDAQPSTYAMLAEIDFRHPLFAPFADPRFSDFTKIHIWKYRQLDLTGLPHARVIAKFDAGDPAIVEVPVGAGRIFVLLTGWLPADSQLAVSSKFVPLLWSLLELSGGITPRSTQFFVGDRVPPPQDVAATAVRTPDGETVALDPTAEYFGSTAKPGIYEFVAARPHSFAVNLDAAESRTAPMDTDELQTMGVPLVTSRPEGAPAVESRVLLQGIEAENRQKLWRWFIAATLAVLLIETALAGWTARRTNLRMEEATS
jgi:hypothetical protein